MPYFKLFQSSSDLLGQQQFADRLKGVFINTSYESSKSRCSEAFVENFLFLGECMDMQTTVARLRDMCSSFMAPIKEVECNHNQLCYIKCEDFDVKVEVENTGPFSFNLTDDVYVLPPIPNQIVDVERLKVDLPRGTFLKPLLVPRIEIANVYEDVLKSAVDERPSYSSLLFKTFPDVADELVKLLTSGCQFVPCGYVVSKSSHEPPSINTVKVKPFDKFVMKVVKPTTPAVPVISDFVAEGLCLAKKYY
jgi:hypothetical protein